MRSRFAWPGNRPIRKRGMPRPVWRRFLTASYGQAIWRMRLSNRFELPLPMGLRRIEQ